ncbi:MAG: V-type ATP synthase subunit I [Spirochaetaceae bacterium]|nr:MAG: V-type ATP synthase subunit I [Spirochaetaceae bacterium]
MIVAMKKAHVIIQASQRKTATEALGSLGLMHVTVERAESDSLAELQRLYQDMDKAIALVGAGEKSRGILPATSDAEVARAADICKNILAVNDKIRELSDARERIGREIDRLQPLGDFDPADVAWLQERGYGIQIRALTSAEYASRPQDIRSWLLQKQKGRYLVAFLASNDGLDDSGDDAKIELGTAFAMPSKGLNALKKDMEATNESLLAQNEALEKLATQADDLKAAMLKLASDIEFESVSAGMEQDESLCVLSGYIPASDAQKFQQAAAQNGWAVLLRDPAEDDVPPTYVKNPRWIRIIQPVFDFLGTVPGYREFDISALFLIFFAIFFGMIISDAGYGSLLFLPALFFSIKAKIKTGRVPDPLILTMVLTLATIAWGSITGNWFGYEPIADMAPFSYLVVDAFDSFEPHSSQTVQLFCFGLGVIHLTFAFLWNTKRALSGPHKLKAFAELGWLVMIVGLFFLVLNVVFGAAQYPLPSFALPLILGGFGAVTLFSEQEGNFIKGVGKGFAGLMTNGLSGVSRFSDIISYIRLFAVGLASLAIAGSFNDMGLQAASGIGGVGGTIAATLIIFLGHTINLFMAGLSVVVHGVRLNMLEFSGALGMEWTGQIFRPFRTNIQ